MQSFIRKYHKSCRFERHILDMLSLNFSAVYMSETYERKMCFKYRFEEPLTEVIR